MKTIPSPLLSTDEIISIIKRCIPVGRIWVWTEPTGMTVSIEWTPKGKIIRFDKKMTKVEIIESTRAYQEAWFRVYAKEAAKAFENIEEAHREQT